MIPLSGKQGRWTAALLISLLIHCALLFLFDGAKAEKKPKPVMNVKLVFAPVSRENGGGNPQKARPQPQKEKPTAIITQKVTVKKKKEVTIKEIAAAPVENKESAVQTEPLTGVPDETTAETGGGNAKASGYESASQSDEGSGGKIADVNTLEVMRKVLPDYPAFSRKRKEEGTSVIVASVEKGRVQSAEIEKSSGYDRLDSAALRAVKEWRFRHDGYIKVRVPFVFRIR